MDPKLIEAITLRIKAGYSKEKIQAEVMSASYSKGAFLEAYSIASASLSPDDKPKTEAVVLAPEKVVTDLPSYQSLFSQSWFLLKSNIALLIKGIVAFLGVIILSGVTAVLIITFLSTVTKGEYVFKFVLLFTLFVFAMLAIVATFAALLRGLLYRKDNLRFSRHFGWTFLNIVGITLVSLYVNIVTQIGYLFFFIPGLMLSVYLIFAIYFSVSGEKSGMSTLTASTALVYGRFFGVFGRILASVVLLSLVMAIVTLLSSLITLINPFFVPLFILSIVTLAILSAYFQLGFTVILFEALKKLPVAKTLPLRERSVTNIYRTIVGLVIFVCTAILIFGGYEFIKHFDKNTLHTAWSNSEIMTDIANKRALKIASEAATLYKNDKGSYAYVCEGIPLPATASCLSTDASYAMEIPLSWGFYCLDSTGYNEVKRRSVIKSTACTSEETIPQD